VKKSAPTRGKKEPPHPSEKGESSEEKGGLYAVNEKKGAEFPVSKPKRKNASLAARSGREKRLPKKERGEGDSIFSGGRSYPPVSEGKRRIKKKKRRDALSLRYHEKEKGFSSSYPTR